MNRSFFVSVVVAVALGGATGYCFRHHTAINDETVGNDFSSIKGKAIGGLGEVSLNSFEKASLQDRHPIGNSCSGMLSVVARFGVATPHEGLELLTDYLRKVGDTLPDQLTSYLCMAFAEVFASHPEIDDLTAAIQSMDLRSQIEYQLRKVRDEQYELQKLGRVCPELALSQLETSKIVPNEATLIAIGLGLLKTSPEALPAVLDLSEDPAALHRQFVGSIENVNDMVQALDLLPEPSSETLDIAIEALGHMDPGKALDVARKYSTSHWIAAMYGVQGDNAEIAMAALGLITKEAPEHLPMLISAIDDSEIVRRVILDSEILNLETEHVGTLIKKLTLRSENDAKDFLAGLPDHLRQDASIAGAVVHSLALSDLDEALALFDNDVGYAEIGIAAALAGNEDLDAVKEHLILNPEVVSAPILQSYCEKILLSGVTLPEFTKQAQLFAPEQRDALLNIAVSFAAKVDPYSASLLLANIVNYSGNYDQAVRNLVIQIPDDYEAQLRWIETISDPNLRESVTREISR